MAGETYRYNVVIGVDVVVNNNDSAPGIEQVLSRSEKKIQDQVAKIQNHINSVNFRQVENVLSRVPNNVSKATDAAAIKVTTTNAAIVQNTAQMGDKVVALTRKRIAAQLTEEQRFDKELEKLGLLRVKNLNTGQSYLKGGQFTPLSARPKAPTASAAIPDIDKAAPAIEAVGDAAAGTTSRIASLAASLGPMGAALVAGTIAAAAAIIVVAALAYGFFKLGQAVFNTAESFAKYGIEISKSMVATGLAAETVSALRHEAEGLGIDFTLLERGLSNFRSNIGKAVAGSEEARRYLKLLGIDGTKAIYDIDGAFKTAVAAIVKTPPGIKQTQMAFAAFGEDAYKLLPFFNSFNGDVDKAIERAKELGIVLGGKDVEAAKLFTKNLNDLKGAAWGVALMFGREFMPTVTKALKVVTDFIVNNKDEIKGWAIYAGEWVMYLAEKFGYLLQRAQATGEWIRDNAQYFGGAAGAWAANAVMGPPGGGQKWATPLGQSSDSYDPSLSGNMVAAGAENMIADPAALEAQRAELEKQMEKTIDRNKRDWDAAIQLWEMSGSDAAAKLSKVFGDLQEALQEGQPTFDKQEAFSSGVQAELDRYQASTKSILDTLDSLEKTKAVRNKATDNEMKVLEKQQADRRKKYADDAARVSKQANDIIDRTYDAQTEKYITGLESRHQRELEIRSIYEDKFAAVNQRSLDTGLKTEQEYLDTIMANELEAFDFKKRQLEEVLAAVVDAAAKTGDIDGKYAKRKVDLEHQIQVVTDQRQNQEYLNEDRLIPIFEAQRKLWRAIAKLHRENADETHVRARRSNQALQEQLSLEHSITQLQDERANVGINSSLIYQRAWEDANLAVERAFIEANESIIRSNVRLNDSTVFHSEQTKAIVLEHLANQVTASESAAGSIIEIYDYATSMIGKAMDKIGIGKIPGVGSMIKNQLTGWITNMTRGLMDKIFPGASDMLEKTTNPVLHEAKEHTKLLKRLVQVAEIGSYGGAGASRSPFGSPAGLPGIFGGFGSGGGMGPGGTPMYNPNRYLPTGAITAAGEYNVNGNDMGVPPPSSGPPPRYRGHEQGHLGGGGSPKRFSLQGLGKSLFGDQGFGWNSGTIQGIGGLAGVAGGMIGGPVGGGEASSFSSTNQAMGITSNWQRYQQQQQAQAQGSPKRFSLSGLNKSLFGSQGFGWNSGTIQGIGGLAGVAGGMIGGDVGSVLSGVAGGIGAMASLSSILSISSIGGPIGLAVGAAIGGLLALGSILFGKSKQKKADKKTAASAMSSAKDQLLKLLKDVQSDKIDGEQAISQAGEIRKEYLDAVSQLKTGSVKRTATAAVRELDTIITQIKTAAANQTARKDRLLQLVPTFGDGGSVSAFSGAHSNLGYITGPGGPKDDKIPAMLSNREYVLDADTTKNIGVANLDMLRRHKGKNVAHVMRGLGHYKAPQQLAEGGFVTVGIGSPVSTPASVGSAQAPKIHVTNNIYQTSDGVTVSTEVWLDTPEGKQKITDAVEENIYRQGTTGPIPKALRSVMR